MERRIFGLENEYGVTCTLRGQRRLSPDEVARYLFRRVVSWGRSSNVFLENGARLYLDVGSHPEYATPECDSIARPGRARQGGGADPRGSRAQRRAAAPRGGDPGRGLPVQEQHRLGGQLVRVPRELPRRARRRLHQVHRRPHPVPRDAPGVRRRGEGAADGSGRDVLHLAAGRAHLGGRVERDDEVPADHQHARRAARRRRAVPAAARDRGRLEHVGVHDVPQARDVVDPAPHARRRLESLA